MAAHMLLATSALVDAGTLTGGGTISSALPVTNLQVLQPGKVCRWTSLSGMYVECDLGSAVAVNCVALLAHNGTSSAQWRIRGATSQANLTAAPGYDSGTVTAWPSGGYPAGYGSTDRLHSILYLSTAQSYRWWRIDITDAGNPAGYFEAGRLYIDAGWVLSRNWAYGAVLGRDDPTEHVVAVGGQTWPVERASARVWDIPLGKNTVAETLTNLGELARTRGKAKDILAVLRPEATDYLQRGAIYGLFVEAPGLTQPHFNRMAARLQIRELLP